MLQQRQVFDIAMLVVFLSVGCCGVSVGIYWFTTGALPNFLSFGQVRRYHLIFSRLYGGCVWRPHSLHTVY
jgi:hypothetical protein